MFNLNEIKILFKENNYCEIQSETDVKSVNIAKIIRNVNGRILFELINEEDKAPERNWVFFSDSKVHPLGWAHSNKYKYLNKDYEAYLKPPINPNEHISPEKDSDKLDRDLRNQTTLNTFKVNYFMECLYKSKFYVARVCETGENLYFKLELDSDERDNLIICYFYAKNLSFNNLFPCNWCSRNNLRLLAPKNWPKDKIFDWQIYINEFKLKNETDKTNEIYLTENIDCSRLFNWSFLSPNVGPSAAGSVINEASHQSASLTSQNPAASASTSNSSCLSDKFQIGMYLECVDPLNDSQIVLAKIFAKIEHVIFVKFIQNSHEFEANDTLELQVYTIDSHDLFPIGWCELNSFYPDNLNKTLNNVNSLDQNSNSNNRDLIRSDFKNIPLLSQFKSNYFQICFFIINSSL